MATSVVTPESLAPPETAENSSPASEHSAVVVFSGSTLDSGQWFRDDFELGHPWFALDSLWAMRSCCAFTSGSPALSRRSLGARRTFQSLRSRGACRPGLALAALGSLRSDRTNQPLVSW